MPYDRAVEYYEAITVIEAQQTLVDMNVSDYPRMKSDGRKKYYRSMRKLAYPVDLVPPKEMDFEEFFERMGHGRREDHDSN